MVKVKICGNRNRQDIRKTERADAVGFIVETPESRRNISTGEAARLVAKTRLFTDTVIVTTEVDPESLKRITSEVQPDYVQLHSELTFDRIKEISSTLAGSVGLISLLSVDDSRECLEKRARKLTDLPLKGLLLDSKVEGRSGGTGQAHDWKISRKIRDTVHPFPVILAGGLNPSNVGEAIKTVRPYGVDVATGVESDGEKSALKVGRFLKEVGKK